MATVVSAANKTAFCTRAHRAIATRVLDGALVEAALDRGARSSLSPGLQATLEFLEKLTVRPEEVTAADARAVLASGVAAEALEDAIAVASIFNIIDRYADALDFEVPSEVELARAAARLLARGYAA